MKSTVPVVVMTIMNTVNVDMNMESMSIVIMNTVNVDMGMNIVIMNMKNMSITIMNTVNVDMGMNMESMSIIIMGMESTSIMDMTILSMGRIVLVAVMIITTITITQMKYLRAGAGKRRMYLQKEPLNML